MQTSADHLTDVLNALKVDSSDLVVSEYSHPWGLEMSFHLPFGWTIVSGQAWLAPPNGPAFHMRAGDTLILPRGTHSGEYRFLSAPDVQPIPSDQLWQQQRLRRFVPGGRSTEPTRLVWGGGGALTRVVSWAFSFKDRHLGLLVEALPEQMLIRATDVHAGFVDALLNFPFGPDGAEQPGYSAVSTQMVQLLLTYLVQVYALRCAGHARNWLTGLTDHKIACALAVIHNQPQESWTVDNLAAVSGMSRSAFAVRFREVLGQTPAHYVRNWRMHLAREALASGRPVTQLAHDMGYQSEAAFRAAFKRVTGQQPRAYRKSLA